MKKYLLNVIPFIIAGICFLAYNVIGSEVLADGTLSEPFYLIPMAYLCINWFGLANSKCSIVIY